MGLTMSQRKAITAQTVERYRRATRRQKAALLDEFVRMHGCTRHHAGWVLRMWGKTVFERRDGQLVAVVVGQRRPRRHSARHYDERVAAAVRRIWHLFGFLCGKRLVAVLRTQLAVLEKFGELDCDPDVRRKVIHPGRWSPAHSPGGAGASGLRRAADPVPACGAPAGDQRRPQLLADPGRAGRLVG